ncbi:3-phosphoserine/phosphohydroxythreonine transaminase [Parasphaerochaeta coccoides]|uniref:3-phosphoserine/phosphohydroxythreonine transaminase n=1 Tax=Parasphaerochaeta coccoides TaxID=273376 RepID=UPI0002F0E588|nr:3-phosphoserine/phosphohydroxythreonine transaminase [Parasphaerochaeta coccoides]
MERKKIFFAGPSVMPVEVLTEMSENLVDYHGQGLSMLEASHRGGMFEDMYDETLALIRQVMDIPDEYEVFFLGGGATLQFSMIPLNFLKKDGFADYADTGTWSGKAASDAKTIGTVRLAYDGASSHYTSMPDPAAFKPDSAASYLYICSNETVGGIEWPAYPETGNVPLIADMSSDFFSRPVRVKDFGMIYGGIQKNLGPAGATLLIIRKDLLESRNSGLPTYLDYGTHVSQKGLYNTPPVFAIWAVKLVLDWIVRNGGLAGMDEKARSKSSLLYDVIDNSGGFYRSPVDRRFRSRMNIVFRLATEELENELIAESKKLGMLGLKGHRSVGGLRASVYNALPEADVHALVDYMRDFQARKG